MSDFEVLVTAPQWSEEAAARIAAAGGRLSYLPDMKPSEDELLARLAEAPVDAIVLRGSAPLTAKVLEAARPRLKIVAKNGAGVDSVDLAAAARLNIAVAVAAGANANAVAEHALALMLALTRELPAQDRQVRAGGWAGAGHQGRDFRGSVVGIVGYGAIGRATAQLARALGARVIVLRRSGEADDHFEVEPTLERLLPRLDLLSLHCPLNEQTRGLIGARELALLKPGALLINTARGALIDEPALVQALQSGQLAGAGLDCFAQEPLGADHPLAALPQVILSPHTAGVTRGATRQVALLTAANVLDHLAGLPLPPGHRLPP